jgi:L-fucose isomerase-like protein
MCGSQQLGYVLRELGHPSRFVFGDAGDTAIRDRVLKFARAATLAQALRKTRLGLIGYRVPGMTEVTFDELELKSLLGPRVVHLGVNALEEAIEGVDEKQARELWDRASPRFGKVSVPDSDLLGSLKATIALREWCGEHLLAGAAVACYPELMGRVCLAASVLADEGIVIGCEGDMNSTAAMLILSRLTGEPVHNTDPLGVDREENSIVFSHCGSGSPSLAESRDKIELGHVRLAGEGCCVLFPGKPGRVTLVNLVGRKGTYRMGVFTGLAVPTKMVFAGNPTKIVLDGGVDRFLEVVAREGLGHHWMVGYGDVTGELRELADLVGLELIRS